MDHKKVYATLVGRVDTAVTILEDMTARQEFDWFHVSRITELLKAALLEAEDAYIESAEDADHRLIVLPRRAEGSQ